jgi:hypothetical protein
MEALEERMKQLAAKVDRLLKPPVKPKFDIDDCEPKSSESSHTQIVEMDEVNKKQEALEAENAKLLAILDAMEKEHRERTAMLDATIEMVRGLSAKIKALEEKKKSNHLPN